MMMMMMMMMMMVMMVMMVDMPARGDCPARGTVPATTDLCRRLRLDTLLSLSHKQTDDNDHKDKCDM
jgi:hypothetical protein